MFNNIDEILKASDNYVNEEPNHSRKDGLKDFARGNVNLRIGNSDYTAEIIIGNNGKKLYLYDVINLRLITIKERRSNNKPLSNDGKSLKNITPSKSSISQNNKNDNNILNAYAGRKAAEVNLEELENAEKMEKEGKSFEEIFKRTGWFRGIDNRWRYEIDDSKMTFNRRGHLSLKNNQDYRRYEELTEKILGSGTFSKEEWEEFGQLEKTLAVISKFKNGGNTVGDYVKHDEMFKQYPFLRDVKLEFFSMNNKKSGYYDGLKNTIFINKELKNNADGAKRKILHELQYAIQKYEGFAGGANVEYWKGEKNKEINRSMLKAQESNKESDWDEHIKLENRMYENPKYGQLYQELLDARWKLASAVEYVKEMTPEEMYENTAGEIEARDVSKRMDYTNEQRGKIMPNSGDGKTLFSKGNEYSYSEEISFKKQVDKAISGEWNIYNSLYVSDTTKILQDVGLRQLPMLYTKKHLLDAIKPRNDIRHHHGLTVEQVKQLPEILEKPAIIMDSLKRNDSIVVISDVFDDYGQPIIVSVKIDGTGMYELKKLDSNFITSVYGKSGIDNMKLLVTNIMLPVAIFHALATADYSVETWKLVGIMFVMLVVSFGVGFLLKPLMNGEYRKYLPFMVSVYEGGLMAYPLYTSLCGQENLSQIAVLDIAGLLFGFSIYMGMLGQVENGEKINAKKLCMSAFHTPAFIASVLGILAGLSKVVICLIDSPFGGAYLAVEGILTTSVTAIILIVVGYSMELTKELIRPCLKTILMRVLLQTLMAIGVLWAVHLWIGDNMLLNLAIISYMSAPATFSMQTFLKKEEGSAYVSTTNSMYCMVSILVYIILAAVVY